MLKGSLVWKLTIWFLLLSLLPIGVIVLFVRQDVSEELMNLAKEDAGSEVSLLAVEISSSKDDRRVQGLVADAASETQMAFLIGEDGGYLAHGQAEKVGGSMLEDFSAELVQKVVDGTDGVVVEDATGRLVGFSSVPGAFTKAVVAVDESAVSAPMLRIERSALVQLAVSLIVIDVAIWVVFRPIQQLTRAAEEVGAGNLDVRIDPADMEGELEVLTNAFNEMTEKVRGAYEGLEQTVSERTEELRESEDRYRTLFEDSRNAIFISSGDGTVVDANQAALELFAFTRDDAVGSDIGDRFVDPADRERFRTEIARTGSIREYEVRLRSRGGPEIDCLLTATRQLDAEGNSLGVMGIIHDITERKRAEEQGRDLVVLQERNRMAREIHDTLAQGFTGIVVQLEAAEQVLDGDHADVGDHLTRAKKLARESLQEARRSVWDLLPKALEERSLEAALDQAVDGWANDGRESASFSLSGDRRELPSEVQAALLRICQESLTNVRRHAVATEVSVDLKLHAEAAHLQVQDNGRGFDFEVVREGGHGGFGLAGMEQRARLLNGTLSVQSQNGKGTLVEARIPLG